MYLSMKLPHIFRQFKKYFWWAVFHENTPTITGNHLYLTMV